MKLPFSLNSGQAHWPAKQQLRYSLIALAISAITINTTHAQELEEVVVTGSYLSKIRQSDVPSPTTVLGET